MLFFKGNNLISFFDVFIEENKLSVYQKAREGIVSFLNGIKC